jgi:choline kinase
MKVGILAGGLGSRLAEETDVRTKPMVEGDGDLVFSKLICLFERRFEA